MMSDPLSIATAVQGLLRVTGTVDNELKKFHDGASIIDKTILELEKEIEVFRHCLRSMQTAFENVTTELGTGNIASLWENIAQAMDSGRDILWQLQDLITQIDRDSNHLDQHRKMLRLNRAECQLVHSLNNIRSHRDSLQMMLSTMILLERMPHIKIARQRVLRRLIQPDADARFRAQDTKIAEDGLLCRLIKLDADVRRIARDLDKQIEDQQMKVLPRQNQDVQGVAEDGMAQNKVSLEALVNLRSCVRSAASTISSATFPASHGEAMRRWMESRLVHEYEATLVPRSQPAVPDVPASSENDEDEDLDSDIEKEIVELPSTKCRKKFVGEEIEGAEAMVRNCVARLDELFMAVRCVVVGEGDCGKTCLLRCFSGGAFSDKSLRPTTFDDFIGHTKFKGRDMELVLWDTAGGHRTFDTPGGRCVDDFSKLGFQACNHADVVLICFDISNPDSRKYIEEDWISEVLHFCRRTPFVLVGCKADLRDDASVAQMLRKNGQRPVTKAEGKELCWKIGAEKYIECSAKTGDGVQKVFEKAVRVALTTPPKPMCRPALGELNPFELAGFFVLALAFKSASVTRSWFAKWRTA